VQVNNSEANIGTCSVDAFYHHGTERFVDPYLKYEINEKS
jgi:hypothetical protein